MALPCPSPHSPAAKAMAKPATSTPNGPSQLPDPSAAKASPGTPRTATPARISERRTRALLCACVVLMELEVFLRMFIAVSLVPFGVLEGARDVEHGQHHEDEGLEKRDENLQGVQE